MTSTAHALISWIPPEKGGRANPPPGPIYSSVARFEDDDKWPHESWSLVLKFERFLQKGRYVLATVRFLSPDGPAALLREGTRFEMMEGSKRIAKGIVVPEHLQIPAELNPLETMLIG